MCRATESISRVITYHTIQPPELFHALSQDEEKSVIAGELRVVARCEDWLPFLDDFRTFLTEGAVSDRCLENLLTPE
jgi:hypothetical protein